MHSVCVLPLYVVTFLSVSVGDLIYCGYLILPLDYKQRIYSSVLFPDHYQNSVERMKTLN